MRAPVTWTAYVDKNQVFGQRSDEFQNRSGKGLTLLLASEILVSI
jgi:hypothetical protein